MKFPVKHSRALLAFLRLFVKLAASAGGPNRLAVQQPASPHVSKKITVTNSPWGRTHERPSDCQRWIAQGHAFMTGGNLEFTKAFVSAVTRVYIEQDPDGYDDGVPRRWVGYESVHDGARHRVKQLKLVRIVGTGKGVHKRRDDLIRRQSRRDQGHSVLVVANADL